MGFLQGRDDGASNLGRGAVSKCGEGSDSGYVFKVVEIWRF